MAVKQSAIDRLLAQYGTGEETEEPEAQTTVTSNEYTQMLSSPTAYDLYNQAMKQYIGILGYSPEEAEVFQSDIQNMIEQGISINNFPYFAEATSYAQYGKTNQTIADVFSSWGKLFPAQKIDRYSTSGMHLGYPGSTYPTTYPSKGDVRPPEPPAEETYFGTLGRQKFQQPMKEFFQQNYGDVYQEYLTERDYVPDNVYNIGSRPETFSDYLTHYPWLQKYFGTPARQRGIYTSSLAPRARRISF